MRIHRWLWVSTLALLFVCGSLSAGIIGSDLLTVEARSAMGAGTFRVPLTPDMEFSTDGVLEWNLPQPVEIWNEGRTQRLAVINDLAVRYVEDPVVSLLFDVQSGISTTNFQISSALLSFPEIVNPPSFASAAVTVTDTNNNGATLTGTGADAKVYVGSYNGPTKWATLISSQTVPPETSVAVADRRPAMGREAILDTVSSMSAQFSFELSASDLASGTSTFDIVPEPASLALLALTGFALQRRRR